MEGKTDYLRGGMLISKHCVSVLIADSRSFSLNIDTCCKQAASSKEASPACLCWFFAFGGFGGFFKKRLSLLILHWSWGLGCVLSLHSMDNICTIITHFMDKVQQGAEIFQVEENSPS